MANKSTQVKYLSYIFPCALSHHLMQSQLQILFLRFSYHFLNIFMRCYPDDWFAVFLFWTSVNPSSSSLVILKGSGFVIISIRLLLLSALSQWLFVVRHIFAMDSQLVAFAWLVFQGPCHFSFYCIAEFKYVFRIPFSHAYYHL